MLYVQTDELSHYSLNSQNDFLLQSICPPIGYHQPKQEFSTQLRFKPKLLVTKIRKKLELVTLKSKSFNTHKLHLVNSNTTQKSEQHQHIKLPQPLPTHHLKHNPILQQQNDITV
jgi:hypothetical protein